MPFSSFLYVLKKLKFIIKAIENSAETALVLQIGVLKSPLLQADGQIA